MAIYTFLPSLRENPQGFSWQSIKLLDFAESLEYAKSLDCGFYKMDCFTSFIMTTFAILRFYKIFAVFWIASLIFADFLAKTGLFPLNPPSPLKSSRTSLIARRFPPTLAVAL